MGTRADFYVGPGEQSEWLGSIAWDGHPESMPPRLLYAVTERQFRAEVDVFLTERDDATRPDDGWPWPWNDSGTTDYAYAFDDGKVWASNFGSPWFDPLGEHPDRDDDAPDVPFPDMSARKNVVLGGARSGQIIVSRDTEGRMHVD